MRSNITTYTLALGLTFLLLTNSWGARAQSFIPPVDFRMLLSGTFGELRSNHFHSGIDIRTGGVEGKPIYAIADGTVSRVYVSPSGFGKALYVDHPEGYTSVYAHLKSFNGKIAGYVEEQQYKKESFALDINVPAGLLKVRKGDIIAWSGNSGSSQGPHLHFEIRDAATQEPLDPMKLGMDVKDFIRPTIQGLKIYPEGQGSTLNGSGNALKINVHGWGPVHRLDRKDTLIVTGAVSFGLMMHDLLNDASNKNGVASMKAYLDGVLFFSYTMDRFAFSETRYINSMIDYAEYKISGRRYQRTRVDPGNKLGVYEGVVNRGIIRPDPGIHHIRFVVADHNDNEGILEFPVKFLPLNTLTGEGMSACAGRLLIWGKEHRISEKGLELVIPSNALYDSVCFEYSSEAGSPSTYGPIHILHNNRTPLHSYCTLRIAAESVPAQYRSKAILVRLEAGGRRIDAGGSWENGWLSGRIRDFGRYAIALDTLAPRLAARNLSEGASVKGRQFINFTVSDDLSGVAEYRAELNGKWVLMEYDAKNNLLSYALVPSHWQAGDNTLVVEVKDDVGNSKELKFNLKY
jgi:hypothetical protein